MSWLPPVRPARRSRIRARIRTRIRARSAPATLRGSRLYSHLSPEGLGGKRSCSGRGSGCAEGCGGQRCPLPAHPGTVLSPDSGVSRLQASAGPSLPCAVHSINENYTPTSCICPVRFGHTAPPYGGVKGVPVFLP